MSVLNAHCNILLSAAICFAGAVSAGEIVYEYEDDPVHTDIIPRVHDLRADGVQAKQAGIPVMIEFSTEWCEYCRALEQQVLEPMIRSGEYTDRLIIRKVMVDDHIMLRDFDGRQLSSTRLGHVAGVELYPTLVFFDGDGEEIAGRIVGITVMDYIPQKIDKALEYASRVLSGAPPGER